MSLKTLAKTDVKNKAVLMRVDYNVTFANGEIADETRIKQSLPTIEYLLKNNVKRIVLMSHLGEPKTPNDPKFSLSEVAVYLAKVLKKEVLFFKNYLEPSVVEKIQALQNGEVILLENLRYYQGESKNDSHFASQLAKLGEVFVNDAFGSCHRAHASIVGVCEFLPSCAGLLLEKEITMIGNALEKPQHPFVAIIGGAKATTKIPIIEKLMLKADDLLLGGGVANTFLKALGYHIGRSIYSPDSLHIAQTLLWRATRSNTRIFLPNDVVIGTVWNGESSGTVSIEEIPRQFMALDIGKKTRDDFCNIISQAKTIIWNGPMGVNEVPAFHKGTDVLYDAIAKNKEATSIVGGGDTLVSIKHKDYTKDITHVSTGGGAMLEFIEKSSLPGIEVLGW